jgi:hypothetical protein
MDLRAIVHISRARAVTHPPKSSGNKPNLNDYPHFVAAAVAVASGLLTIP